MYLLDVNLLIALCDEDHVHREIAKGWFQKCSNEGWATCPLTENAFLRIIGSPSYPGGPGTPAAIRPLLQSLRALPGHQFWGDEISLADDRLVPSMNGITSKMLTDLYLLGLAVQRGARFATLDTRLKPRFVQGGSAALVRVEREA